MNKRKYVMCEGCEKSGNHYYSEKYRAAMCDLCLALPPIKQSAIMRREGPRALEQAIYLNFEKLFETKQDKGESMNPSKMSYGTLEEISMRLEQLRGEFDERNGRKVAALRERHRNKQAQLLKIEAEYESAKTEATEATKAYADEKLELEKLEQTIDNLAIQKKALYRQPSRTA